MKNGFVFFLISVVFVSGCQSMKKPSITVGLDRVNEFNYLFKGKRIGIIANHTSYDSKGRFIVDIFRSLPGSRVTALFGPEHGFKGNYSAGKKIDDSDALDSIPIYSLYGKTRKPTPEMLSDVDVLVFDIQDVGARFYTYIWTMALAMEAAAEQGVRFVVLDRPNPINGVTVEGTVLDTAFATFVGLFPIPVRHGMTVGELAKLFNGEGWLKNGVKVDLKVVPMQGWKRKMWFDQTGLKFIPPSPNMPNLLTATVYPGLCLLEGTNVSVGRGTEKPFLQFGTPWIDSDSLISTVNAYNLKGVRFRKVEFTPRSIRGKSENPKYKNEKCRGLEITIEDRDRFKAFITGVRIVQAIHRLFPENFQWRPAHFDRLSGNDEIRKTISEGKDIKSLIARWERDLQKFQPIREKYLLYK